MKHLFLTITIVLLFAPANFAQRNKLITGKSAGDVKLGMTVAQARKAMRGFRLIRGRDGEGLYLVDVMKGRKIMMSLYSGEKDQRDRINEKAKIELIMVWDRMFRTSTGVHPDMLIKDAERKIGRMRQVEYSQTEQREYATFTKQSKGVEFRVGGVNNYAGLYAFPKVTTSKRYMAGSMIIWILVTGATR